RRPTANGSPERTEKMLRLRIASAVLLGGLASAACLARADEAPCAPETLRVMLYPYVPEASDLFLSLETEFEKRHPCVDLQLVATYKDAQGKQQPLVAGYYGGGALAADADVYELDAVLLGDAATSKIASTTLQDGRFLPFAVSAATVDGRAYGVPH